MIKTYKVTYPGHIEFVHAIDSGMAAAKARQLYGNGFTKIELYLEGVI